jgi:uncharacterized membrane protein YhaH (DUF805 family)
MSLSLLAQATSNGDSGGMMMFLGLLWVVVFVFVIAGLWKTFIKAGKPGWGAIVPVYNVYLTLKVAGRPGWWLLLYLIPVVDIVVHVLVSLDIAKAFGKTPAFGVVAVWLFAPIGFLILGFGDAKYSGAPKH